MSTEWLIGEAAQLHLSVERAAVEQEYKASKEHFFPTSAKQAEYLKTTGRTVSDIMVELEVGQLSNEVYKHLAQSEGALTQQEIAQYYAAHLEQFAVPEERELGIVRAETRRAAAQAKRMLASGATFASVAGGSRVKQPIFAHEGVVRGLAPGVYAEKPLNDAIFTAPLNVLKGPVRISLGYYVFEVKKVTPAHEQTLSEAEATIRAELPELLHRQRLGEFVRHYKDSWRRATTCRPGYVIRMCSEFRGPPLATPEDPYTF